MVKQSTEKIVVSVMVIQDSVEELLEKYQSEYADYGMDDISNDIIVISCALEQVRLKLKYALVQGDACD